MRISRIGVEEMNKAWRMALAAAAVGMVAAVVAAQRDSSRITKEQASTKYSLTIRN